MSNASPLKEPSMDEILASIRRIIESGDERPTPSVRPRAVSESLRVRAVAMQAEAAPARRTAPGFAGSPTMPAADPMMGVSDASGGAARQAGDEETSDEWQGATDWPAPLAGLASLSANDRPPLTVRRAVADVAAPRIVESETAEFARTPLESQQEPAAGSRLHFTPTDGAAMALEGLRPATGEYPARVEVRSTPSERAPEPAPYDFNLEFDEESFSSELREEVISVFSQAESAAGDAGADRLNGAESLDEPSLAQETAAPPSLIAETSSLMSEAAGAQVASAFDELARAIREGQMKSMEEMARHMLRPMLQEWLDDNLPRIVERLVREEIERVARGGRG